MNDTPRKWTRWLVSAVKLAVFALLCWFIYRAVVGANDQLNGHQWQVEYHWLVISGVIYLTSLVLPGLFWYWVLRATDQQVGLGESLRSYYISQLGKYVPGKWMVILLRRVLLTRGKVENTVVAASVFYETFTLLAVGSVMSVLTLAIWHGDKLWLILLAGGASLLLGLPTIPRLFELIIRVLGVRRLNPTAGAKFRQVSWRLLAAGWLVIAVGWLLQGVSLWATLRAMGANVGGPWTDLSLHTAAVALAVVAGFLSQIPGGLAVREWVSAQLIEPTYGESVAIVSAILYRLVLVVSELSVSVILYVAGWRRMPRVAEIAEAETELSATGSG